MTRGLWIVTLSGGGIMALTLGLRQSLGLYLEPVSLDLGLGRQVFAFGMGIMNLVWGLASPFAGALADRYGAGRVAALGTLAYAAGLASMTLALGGQQLLLGGTLLGLGLSGAGFSVILGAVGRAASPETRSSALGVASMCGSVGQFAALPYAQVTIEAYGWSSSLLIVAATTLLAAPLAAGLARGGSGPAAEFRQSLSGAFREAAAHRDFWLLNAGFFVCGFQLAFIAVHLPAYLADAGFGPKLALTALMLIGLCNTVGSYVLGTLGDRLAKSQLLAWLYLARSAILLAFVALPLSPASVLAFAAAMGFLWLGTVPLTSALVAHIFGPVHMSMLFGIVFLGHQFGGFLGAWISGYLYDVFASYDVMWWASIALGLMAALLHWRIAERPVPRLVLEA